VLRGEWRSHFNQFSGGVCVEKKSLACIFFWNLLLCLHLCCILSRGLLLNCVQRGSILLTGTWRICVWINPGLVFRALSPYLSTFLCTSPSSSIYSTWVLMSSILWLLPHKVVYPYQRVCYACGVYKTFMNLVLGCLLCKHECELYECVILVQILSRVYQCIGDDFTNH